MVRNYHGSLLTLSSGGVRGRPVTGVVGRVPERDGAAGSAAKTAQETPPSGADDGRVA